MVPLPLNILTPTPAPDRGGPVACLGGPVALEISSRFPQLTSGFFKSGQAVAKTPCGLLKDPFKILRVIVMEPLRIPKERYVIMSP